MFLPFFVLGCRYGHTVLAWLQQQKHAAIWGGLSLVLIMLILYSTQLSQFWWYGSLSYAQLKVDVWQGSLTRLACMLLSSWGIFTLLALFQGLGSRFTRLGQNTLPVYLLHGFVVIWLAHWIQLHVSTGIKIAVCILLSIITCWVLRQSLFDRMLRRLSLWLVKPASKLWKK